MIPPFRALLTVDAEGYTRNRDAELPGLHTKIRYAVECACEQSGLGEAWRGVRFLQSTGDGLLAVLPYDAAALLIYHSPTACRRPSPRSRHSCVPAD
jgi:hypothetical protein